MKKILVAATALALLPFVSYADNYGKNSYGSTVTTTSSSRSSYSEYRANEHQWMGLTGPYVSAFGGWNKPTDDNGFDFDNGWVAGGAVGGKTKWARAELEGSYRNSDIDNAGGSDIDSTSIMANAYWDIENDTMITPYLGLGVGASFVDIDSAGGDDSWEFAYQGMAGARVNVAPRWTVGAEYRYFATTDVGSTDYQNNAVLGTVGYQF